MKILKKKRRKLLLKKGKIFYIPSKYKLKSGDTVQVISGEYKGSIGKILKFFPRIGKAIVEGVNKVIKHIKPNSENNNKGCKIEKEIPINVCKLKYYDLNLQKSIKIGRKLNKDTGKICRFSKQTGEFIL